jgi:hypothetical protein
MAKLNAAKKKTSSTINSSFASRRRSNYYAFVKKMNKVADASMMMPVVDLLQSHDMAYTANTLSCSIIQMITTSTHGCGMVILAERLPREAVLVLYAIQFPP